jgi:hypothetical protein
MKSPVDTYPHPLGMARLVELTEAEAYVDLFRAAPAYMGFQAFSVQAATMLLAPDWDIRLFNRVLGLGIQEHGVKQSIDWIIGQFQQYGVCNYALQIYPHAQPRTLRAWLEARQLIHRDNWAKEQIL